MANLEILRHLFGLDGQVAIVTGAGAGIGKAIATLLAQAGARVAIANRTAETGSAVAAQLTSAGHEAIAVTTDVADELAILQLFETVRERWGAPHILVNNAGVTNKFRLAETTVAQWDEIQRINLRGAFLCIREAAKAMAPTGRGGRIVNISSTSSVHPGVHDNAAYAASKAGLNMLTRSAALDLAMDRITVNAILPGGTRTEGTEKRRARGEKARGPAANPERYLMGRIGEPVDIAAAALFLVSAAGSYVTGQTLVIDGGFLIS